MIKTRKLFLGVAGALAAVTVGAAALPGSPVSARESAQASVNCTGLFSASAADVRENASVSGRMVMEVAGSSLRGAIELGNGQSARVVGETTGMGVFMVIEMPDGNQIMGIGGGANPVNTCRGRMGGLFSVISPNPFLNDMTGTWAVVMD